MCVGGGGGGGWYKIFSSVPKIKVRFIQTSLDQNTSEKSVVNVKILTLIDFTSFFFWVLFRLFLFICV